MINRLAREAEMELARSGAKLSCSEWMQMYTKHPRHPSRAWSFAGHEYQIAIADDWHPNQIMNKAAQLGVTDTMLRKGLYFLDQNQGANLIYTMPSDKLMKVFCKIRLKAILEGCDRVTNLAELQDVARKRDSLSAIQVGRSWLLMKATIGERVGISDPADCVMIDEWNASDIGNVSKYRSRLQHCQNPIFVGFSNPTVPEYGTDEYYRVSDENEVVIKCPYCGEWQTLDWEPEEMWTHEHLPSIRKREELKETLPDTKGDEWGFACRACERELCYDPSIKWEWRAAYELPRVIEGVSHNWRGRRLSLLNGWAWQRAQSIVQFFFDMAAKKGFQIAYNMVIGKPFVSGAGKITPKMMAQCEDATLKWKTGSTEGTIVGADQGDKIHRIVVIEPIMLANGMLGPRVIHIEEHRGDLFDGPSSTGRLREISEQYNSIMTVFDAQPNMEAAERLCKSGLGRYWRAFYPPQDRVVMVEPKRVDQDNPDYVVTISRNSLMSRVARMVQSGDARWPVLGDAPGGAGAEFCLQMMKPTRMMDPNNEGREIWVGTPDHFRHAMNYACAGLIIMGNISPVSVHTPGIIKM